MFDKNKYPKTWKLIRARILKRAGNCCERCYVKNHVLIYRCPGSDFFRYVQKDEIAEVFEDFKPGPRTYPVLKEKGWTYVVLTIAHLMHDTTKNEDSDLEALCQRCHLLHDMDHHQAKRKETMSKRKLQPELELAYGR